MRKINPTIKFLSLLFVTLILAYRFDPVLNFAVFGMCMILIVISGVKCKTIALWMIPILIAAIGMFFTGYRFSAVDSMPVRASDFMIYDSKMWNGLAQAGRVLAYAGIGFLFTLTTDRIDLVKSFRRQLRVPQVFAYGLLAAWGIVPQMLLEYRRTQIAFRARGIFVWPFSPALLKPLLVKSIRWSEELAIAMESKGFSGAKERSVYEPIRVHYYDWMFAVLAVGAVAVLAFLV